MSKIKQIETASGNDYYSIDEAAKALGIQSGVVRNYLYLGKFTTYKFKNFTLISRREVNNWK